jgi:hypothetical protein
LALAEDGSVFDSWLGASVTAYLDQSALDTAWLFRRWSPEGSPEDRYGALPHFRDPVLRRVFNRPYIQLHGDTAWILLQGLALLQAFTRSDSSPVRKILLPVYHIGEEPWIEHGSARDGMLRRSRAVYQPNVGPFALASAGRFLVVRYRDWRTLYVERRAGDGYTDYWPESYLEIIDSTGAVLDNIRTPGRVHAVDVDRSCAVPCTTRVAILTEDLETGVRQVLIAMAEL